MSATSLNRRQILSGLMKLLFLIGFAFLSVPFISSFSTVDIEEKQKSTTRWVITLSLSDLMSGEIKHLSWSGGEVWVYARNEKEIESLKNKNSILRDAVSLISDQPDGMKNDFRSANEKYFVFIPRENKKGCQVRLINESNNVVFTEPCYGGQYDAAGRILENSGHKEQQNLAVPEHAIENGILKIGVWTPKI